MRSHIKRILSDVADDAAKFVREHKKILGGAGAAGAASALTAEQIADTCRKGISFGKRLAGVGDAVEKAENPDEKRLEYEYPPLDVAPSSEDYHWECLRDKNP